MSAKKPHEPVLLTEIIEFVKSGPQARILDVTFGRGGHTGEILQKFPASRVTAIDQDPEAIAYGRNRFASSIAEGRLRLVAAAFHRLDQIRSEGPWDFILADLGVSSPQLDEAHRGFSFYHEGPLDMRMDPSQSSTARDFLQTADEAELCSVFRTLGEVRRPERVARAIVADRAHREFTTTRELAGLIERIEGWRQKGHHPATRYFLALRLQVNRELEVLREALPVWMSLLGPGGRLAVVTFHSLEDRIVKWFFKERVEQGRILTKKVIVPRWSEKKMNPRARSAKLRVFERGIDARYESGD
jgi:16S rRNA (cytosine1402-N4)-methyltransferase